MTPPKGAIFTIPAGIPFARALADGVVQRTGGDSLKLADILIFVPTRRAARTLRNAFVVARAGAALGPRIRALGDVGEEELAFDASADDLELPPAIAPLRRRLLLAALVQRWQERRGEQTGMAQAVAYAGELANFLDEAHTRGAELSRLDGLVTGALATHWQEVVEFLKILTAQWPEVLKDEGAMEPSLRRDEMLRRMAQRLEANPPPGLVIAAGSTGSIPATAGLLKTIAGLSSGAVVLPGLDTTLDDKSWEDIRDEPGHPQFGMRQLLTRLGVERGQVKLWGEPEPRASRVRFLSEALRPPPTTDAWRALAERDKASFAQALDGLSLVETATPREEALVIACSLRGALETPSRTAALVTPDRELARRVAAELARWDISIDDSAGQPLSRTLPGAFLALLARAASEQFAPVPLLALLKHPLCAGGMVRADFLGYARELEILVLHGLRPGPGLDGIATALKRKETPALTKWFAALARLLQPFADIMAKHGAGVGELAHAHGLAAEALAATAVNNGPANLWRGDAGEAAARLMSELWESGDDAASGNGAAYAELFRELAEAKAVRPSFGKHPRLAILGPLEARLLHFDLVILGGLNEGTWPTEATTDPWLSRPLRAKLGLEPPERRIGLAAHDFATLSANKEVLLTRALKQDGAPTVASRWLLRVKQLAKGLNLETKLAGSAPLLAWARMLDDGPRMKLAARPAPTPPVAARPRELSVTEIETWQRDPYAIYAKRVLRLKPLDAIDMEAGPAERGNAIHKALERFLKEYPKALPANAAALLLAIGDEEFARAGASSSVLALWRPRFKRVAHWFVEYETARRKQILRSAVEQDARLEIESQGGMFTLTGRADRIDLFEDGTATIVDYKTGRMPGHGQVEMLISPQLPLEAAMLLDGKFAGLKAKSVRKLLYLQLTGGEPPATERAINVVPDTKAAEAVALLRKLIADYGKQTTPYPSRVRPFNKNDVGDYDHLARVREWSVYGEGNE